MNQNFLQGDLQALFDALYTVGAIDPVLKMDWHEVNRDMMKNPTLMNEAMKTVNGCEGDSQKLLNGLHALDSKALNYIAVEVAREFAEFQDRQALH